MNGVHCQTSAIITEAIASFGDAVHVRASGLTPNLLRVPLSAPKFEFSIRRQITPTTTGGSISGTSSSARNKLRPRIAPCSNIASDNPNKNSTVSAMAA